MHRGDLILRLVVGFLLVLWLSSCDSSSGDDATTAKCPRQCNCTGLGPNTVDCREPTMSGKLRGIPNETTLLRVKNTQLEDVQGDPSVEYFQLKTLDLANNKLKALPTILRQTPYVQQLDLQYNLISSIPANAFQYNIFLQEITLSGNPLNVDPSAFNGLSLSLTSLTISASLELKTFSLSSELSSLSTLSLDRCSLEYLDPNLCHQLPKLTKLDVHSNRITRMINFSLCHQLSQLELSRNRIESMLSFSFAGENSVIELHLQYNQLKTISENDLTGLIDLQTLDVSSNELSWIHPDAFAPLHSLHTLDISRNTHLGELPVNGLDSIQIIYASDNPSMRKFPAASKLKKLYRLQLTYAYHCCEFLEKNFKKDSGEPPIVIDNTNGSNYPLHLTENISHFHPIGGDPPIGLPPGAIENEHDPYASKLITCQPEPDPFQPCEDLMGILLLRIGVWLVFLLALVGNGLVLIISSLAPATMDGTRFLVCNLAAADFLMGIYMGFLAIVDAKTLGEFREHGVQWQASAGCNVAGFVAVLSSELSVYTLVCITLDRLFAVRNAFTIEQRLSLNRVKLLMLIGWIYSLVLATLPLIGVSSYGKFAICLPFEVGNTVSRGYVTFLVLTKMVVFFFISSCYTYIMCALRRLPVARSNHESAIAKQMALLIFTDFACWAPIAFFALTSTFGFHLISLNDAKIFAVFVLPLNSCANPFLYGFLSRHFRRDMQRVCCTRRRRPRRVVIQMQDRRSSSSTPPERARLHHHHHHHVEQPSSLVAEHDSESSDPTSGVHSTAKSSTARHNSSRPFAALRRFSFQPGAVPEMVALKELDADKPRPGSLLKLARWIGRKSPQESAEPCPRWDSPGTSMDTTFRTRIRTLSTDVHSTKATEKTNETAKDDTET